MVVCHGKESHGCCNEEGRWDKRGTKNNTSAGIMKSGELVKYHALISSSLKSVLLKKVIN